jgi:hypothetical protein
MPRPQTARVREGDVVVVCTRQRLRARSNRYTVDTTVLSSPNPPSTCPTALSFLSTAIVASCSIPPQDKGGRFVSATPPSANISTLHAISYDNICPPMTTSLLRTAQHAWYARATSRVGIASRCSVARWPRPPRGPGRGPKTFSPKSLTALTLKHAF